MLWFISSQQKFGIGWHNLSYCTDMVCNHWQCVRSKSEFEKNRSYFNVKVILVKLGAAFVVFSKILNISKKENTIVEF